MVQSWTILTREPAEDFGIFQVQNKQVRSPRTGETMAVQTIQFPAWVLVLAITSEEEVVMVRQYRHGTEQICLELPGGLVDSEDTSPQMAARRELLEETGYQAKALELIGECFPQPAVQNNKCFFILAKNAERIRNPAFDEGEDIEIDKIPLKDVPIKIKKKEINHGMVLLGFFFYWMRADGILAPQTHG